MQEQPLTSFSEASIHESLSRFQYIGVRNAGTATLVQGLGLEPEMIVEPTLLDDSIAASKPLITGEYAVSHLHSEPPPLSTLRLPLVSIGMRVEGCQKAYQDFAAPDFDTLICNGAMVLTNTYHGAVLRLKYGVTAHVIANKVKRAKLDILRKRCGLEFLERVDSLR